MVIVAFLLWIGLSAIYIELAPKLLLFVSGTGSALILALSAISLTISYVLFTFLLINFATKDSKKRNKAASTKEQ